MFPLLFPLCWSKFFTWNQNSSINKLVNSAFPHYPKVNRYPTLVEAEGVWEQNMVLWRIFGPRRDEVTVEWRRLHNEELNDMYCSPNIVRVIKWRWMRWAGHVARIGEERGVYRVLVGKPEGKRPLGRPRRRWVDNIRMDLQEVGCGYMDWIELAQDRDRWRTLVSAVMNLRVPWNAGNFLTSCKPVSFSRRILHYGVSK